MKFTFVLFNFIWLTNINLRYNKVCLLFETKKKNSLYKNIISITALTQIKLMSNQQFIKMKYILFFPRDIEFKIEIAILFETYY